jgi:GTP diphosphokinase / guanosine-3',5'-bis(diphosphate) 3'-diphosphatase
MAKCCKPVPGDDIVGYISLGRGITVHRSECPNVKTLARAPERFTPVSWAGSSRQSFRVEIAVDAWDRVRLLEDLSRTLSESGANIIVAHCQSEDQMVRNRFTVELGDVSQIKGLIGSLRGVDGVFDAYRVGPGR